MYNGHFFLDRPDLTWPDLTWPNNLFQSPPTTTRCCKICMPILPNHRKLLHCGMCWGTGHCACFAACSKTLAHLILHCGMCQVQTIVPIFRLVQKFWLTLFKFFWLTLFYIVECARYRPLCLFFRLVQKFWLTLLNFFWLTLLHCGMCQIQAIVPIFRLLQKIWLTLLHCGMCRLQAIVPIFAACSKNFGWPYLPPSQFITGTGTVACTRHVP
jgi:hypothetical protein